MENGSDEMTSWIAIVISTLSLIVASISILIPYFTYKRDRPKLTLKPGVEHSIYKPSPTLSISVVNVGYRATTIREVGFVINEKLEILDEISVASFKLSDEPALIEGGGMKDYTMNLDHWPSPALHADFPIMPYVILADNRQIRGPGAPLLRRLIQGGWNPPHGTPPQMYSKIEGKLNPYYNQKKKKKPISTLKKWMIG